MNHTQHDHEFTPRPDRFRLSNLRRNLRLIRMVLFKAHRPMRHLYYYPRMEDPEVIVTDRAIYFDKIRRGTVCKCELPTWKEKFYFWYLALTTRWTPGPRDVWCSVPRKLPWFAPASVQSRTWLLNGGIILRRKKCNVKIVDYTLRTPVATYPGPGLPSLFRAKWWARRQLALREISQIKHRRSGTCPARNETYQ